MNCRCSSQSPWLMRLCSSSVMGVGPWFLLACRPPCRSKGVLVLTTDFFKNLSGLVRWQGQRGGGAR